ncbi:MAG: AmmeMemoRadiSam system protein B [Candidatus Dadabacteria bacterium]|nr:AmmeMemoRadiSam system protein B [Candidatus Dadabacteria bacterium]NIS08649.1 AmmeMemoRadiSam system protein B [Candidatus Dadabacteria bacterium]NIV42483.1 AmmeMemoRadiSam system protein B [Candidatus Dadabacteria bacterium]NIX15365.1 AmmeMemoRadiSam system protein B [Candidatus Dadabacteria bacterium]NIY22024.1 AmmeMemoRadiSam system protein B [Candidatus Dadabacteria bacterium]
MEYPKLRYVDTFPIEHEGNKYVCLRDPQDTNGNMLLVAPQAIYVISYFTGGNSIVDIQLKLLKEYGELVEKEHIAQLAQQLDDAFLLDSDKYRNHQQQLEDDFKKSEIRLPSHAGLSYPNEPDELTKWIDGYFSNGTNPSSNGKKTVGIISPHIDFSRGGSSYAKAYNELINNEHCDTFIIFGTSHYASVENPFILSKKNYKTPYGEAEVDLDLIDRIESSCEWDLYEGEIFHKSEHSIEFQVVFLQYLFGGKREFKILPILCNSFYRFIESGTSPSEDHRTASFLNCIKEIVTGLGNRAVVIAGADLAHMGNKFGDAEAVNDSTLEWIKNRDYWSIKHSAELDNEAFYRSVEEEKDKRKICGLSPIYALLSVINAKKGEMLDYGQAVEPDTGSVVTYTSMGFYS